MKWTFKSRKRHTVYAEHTNTALVEYENQKYMLMQIGKHANRKLGQYTETGVFTKLVENNVNREIINAYAKIIQNKYLNK